MDLSGSPGLGDQGYENAPDHPTDTLQHHQEPHTRQDGGREGIEEGQEEEGGEDL